MEPHFAGRGGGGGGALGRGLYGTLGLQLKPPKPHAELQPFEPLKPCSLGLVASSGVQLGEGPQAL